MTDQPKPKMNDLIRNAISSPTRPLDVPPAQQDQAPASDRPSFNDELRGQFRDSRRKRSR